MTETHGSVPPDPSPGQTQRSSLGPWAIVFLVVLLLVLHQDNWFWLDGRLVFGFIPIGLFWHACISIGASLTWFLATRFAWPLDTPLDVPAGSSTTKPSMRNESEVSS
ncbi:DUF3311 domain-containing protein [Neorhodopirellula pilleata]|uniref:DUF3311 domain-containing protein n=1 Tax=Neorhodopirellula pilleata TaxID=2714738 RepID=A0A5C5ZKU3_9BACT|nr:DUF3311 domain-containing protein [Neorhodopirellula pilleata]TWT87775.1 hypothetical protein Pla100_59430 [Neorhodopirellula pilleata]